MAKATRSTQRINQLSEGVAASWTLCTDKDDTGATDYADTIGMNTRLYAHIVDGGTDGVTVKLETSADGVNWADLHYMLDGGDTPLTTAHAVGAGSYDLLFGVAPFYARYVRANITVANATSGATITLYAER